MYLCTAPWGTRQRALITTLYVTICEFGGTYFFDVRTIHTKLPEILTHSFIYFSRNKFSHYYFYSN